MKYRKRIYYTEDQKALMWDRYQKGDSLHTIASLFVSERPPSIEDRAVPGHWEGDLIEGSNKSFIATLVERHSRYVMLAKVSDNKTATVVSKALATDKRRVNVNTLYTALFSDLPTGKDFKIPTQPEKRECRLQELIRKINKPIALFIDEAHDLHWRTLIGLKHLVETVEDAKGTLAIIVVGHPKLGNELNKPAMEEVGARAKVFNLDGLGQQRQLYIEWVLDNCSKAKIKPHDIVSKEAISLLAERLITPLQITHYLSLALIKGHTTGTKPVDRDIVDSVLAPDLNTLEPKLARQGYGMAVLCDYLNARRGEVRAYLRGQLAAGKTDEFNKEIHKLGIL